MARYSTCFRTLLAFAIVLTAVSASQAGLFARWRARYDYPAYAPAAVATQPATSVPAAQAVVATPGPTVYKVAKPVVSENAAGTVAPAPQSGSYVPAAGTSSGTYSTLPRSAWDFGKFPPYSN